MPQSISSRPSPFKMPETSGPPLTPEELTTNLSILERKLNSHMTCTAGKNQVFVRSLVLNGGTTRPRIVLKCHLRRDIKLAPEVFYEHIRDVCCGSHETCPAWQAFKERHAQL